MITELFYVSCFAGLLPAVGLALLLCAPALARPAVAPEADAMSATSGMFLSALVMTTRWVLSKLQDGFEGCRPWHGGRDQ